LPAIELDPAITRWGIIVEAAIAAAVPIKVRLDIVVLLCSAIVLSPKSVSVNLPVAPLDIFNSSDVGCQVRKIAGEFNQTCIAMKRRINVLVELLRSPNFMAELNLYQATGIQTPSHEFHGMELCTDSSLRATVGKD